MTTAIAIFSVCLLLVSTSGHFGLSSEHISVEFFITGEQADRAQDNIREVAEAIPDVLEKIPSYLENVHNASFEFAPKVENFFDVAKNESGRLLQKLLDVPSQETIPEKITSQLTNYFNEMENFHLVLCEVLDDVTGFTVDSLQMIRNTLHQFTEAHNDIVGRRNSQPDELCRNSFDTFLWQSSDEVFQCINAKLHITYDIYSITKMTTYHVLKMLEHRIQKIYNCFLFGNYEFRCRFVKNAEADFEKLQTRLDELQMYNEKQKRKVSRNRHQGGGFIKCIPQHFPDGQMDGSLKSCYSSSRNVAR